MYFKVAENIFLSKVIYHNRIGFYIYHTYYLLIILYQ